MSDTRDTAGGDTSTHGKSALEVITELLDVLRAADLQAEFALDDNPSPTQSQDLQDRRDDIAGQIAVLEGRRLAIIQQTQVIQPPDDDTVGEIAALSAEAEDHANQSIGAAAAVDFANRALALGARLAA